MYKFNIGDKVVHRDGWEIGNVGIVVDRKKVKSVYTNFDVLFTKKMNLNKPIHYLSARHYAAIVY